MKLQSMLTIQKSETESELIDGCRKGSAKAQRLMYDRLASKMLGICVRYIKDKTEAEHVMIGGMVKVFEKVEQYTGDGSFEGWVRKIMVNECLMFIRKNKNMSVMRDIDEVSSIEISAAHQNQLESSDIITIIHELPIGYRTIFNLYAIEGYNHAEIADKLNINENTSKSQLSRARKHIQARLAQYSAMVDNKIIKS